MLSLGLVSPSAGATGHEHDHAMPPGAGFTIGHTGAMHDHNRADAYAPIGVMGDHLHMAGGWMLSYRFMRMKMKNNRKGTSGIPPCA